MRWLLSILVAAGFLWSDAAGAIPAPAESNSINEADSQQVARKRRKKKKMKNNQDKEI